MTRLCSTPGCPTPSDAAWRRFWAKIVALPSGCWEWKAGKTEKGYGRFWNNGRLVKAHRFSYELLIGPIPTGLTLDHLCRNRACVNPHHLEPLLMRENILRGNGLCARNARKTHCPRGHPYDMFNTYRYPDGSRECKICLCVRRNEGMRRWRQRRRGGVTCVC